MLDSYPSIRQDEFEKACTDLERRCHDGLSDTDWLSVKWTGEELRIAQRRVTEDKADERVVEEEGNGNRSESEEVETDEIEEEAAVCAEVPVCAANIR